MQIQAGDIGRFRGKRRVRAHTPTAPPLQRNAGPGVFEIALPFRGDAFRVVYAVQLADAIWVIHAFQKKSTQGMKTPKHEVDLIREGPSAARPDHRACCLCVTSAKARPDVATAVGRD